MKGLEPPRLSALDPKSSAATNYATSAAFPLLKRECKYIHFLIIKNFSADIKDFIF